MLTGSLQSLEVKIPITEFLLQFFYEILLCLDTSKVSCTLKLKSVIRRHGRKYFGCVMVQDA